MPIDAAELLFGQITEADIKEFVQGERSPRVDTFSLGVIDLTLDFKIPGDKLKAALQWILGVDFMDHGNNLRRCGCRSDYLICGR